jgi:asparagine synthase (glutamine-hydrolysing)
VCGIAGTIGLPRDIAEPALGRMRSAMSHRGPDGEGTLFVEGREGPPVGLAHRRLAVIDTSSAGLQPMLDPTSACAITFNGEIYNYREVRADLERLGRGSRGNTDTEVILRAYDAWGTDAVHRLRGMFAWCLVDPTRARAWLCRDRLGIKPIYVMRPQQGGLIFASEVRALLAAGGSLVRARLARGALETFLAQGMVCGLDSVLEGARLLAPGESLIVDWHGRETSARRYWAAPFLPARECPRDRPAAVAAIASTLAEAVDLHMISDVPLGLFLSGGIDSGALATVATSSGGSSVHTVAIGFDEPRFDESPIAERVARCLGTAHRTVNLSGREMLSDIGEVFAAMDQPTVDGFNTYFVSRAARRAGLTVALSGVGGDELFGGYATFRDVPFALALRRWAGRLHVDRLVGRAPRSLGGRRGVKALELFSRKPSALSVYLLRRELFLPPERRALHALPEGFDPETGASRKLSDDLDAEARGLDIENQVALFELSVYMRHMLLRDADVFSMAVGLELRVPLLDHALVEAVAPLPGAWKRRDPRPKPLLLDALGGRLPREVNLRGKRGFTFPWQAWLHGALRERAALTLADRDIWRAVAFDADEPTRMWQRFLAGDPRVGAHQIVALWVLAEYVQRHGFAVA